MNREDQERSEKISDEVREAIDENCLAWIRAVFPVAQKRFYEINDLVWSLAFRAGQEAAARRFRKLVERFRDEYADGGALPRWSDEWHAIDDLLQRLDDDLAGEQQ